MSSSPLDAALALHRAGRTQDAERAYRSLLASEASGAGAALAVLLLQQGRDAEAVDVLEPLAAAAPSNAELAVNLSLALRRSGRGEAALTAARRACTLAPGRASAWNALGLAARDTGDHDEALAAFEAGLRIAPNERALRLHRAQTLRRLGRNRDALDAFAALARQAPDLLDAWRGLGDAQAALGQAGAALQSRTRALQLAPQAPDVACDHAIALMQAGDSANAALRFETLLRADAENAQLWCWLGRAQLKLGNGDAARRAFDAAKARDPEDAVIAHFHAAVHGVLPADVESDYIRSLFDDFADRFEHTLVDRLAYATPERLARFIAARGNADAASVLDLGCGTGLMANALARAGRAIDGVDLSPRMLEHARAKSLYRDLHAAEILVFLRDTRSQWDLVVAADVFVYVAALAPVFDAVFARVSAGGVFAFSVERSDGPDTELLPSTGRYRHSPARIVSQLAQTGFVDIVHETVVLRMESGDPVQGELVLARRPA
ncbi:tetratricopeptide repeat protein [Chiayiivirga flava]|uniref:Putative TPR repeat methyltransferase n=1 Tax=Chiayiivirga flava TaxID=659595 RepID=A0A7W8G0Z7_9GAMM|nr:tetratricopeptide repeat protein [Chiayiivirga flava]MBB5208313.1 putative TPR repeat methyltransferase [Chiayiivirga flava]